MQPGAIGRIRCDASGAQIPSPNARFLQYEAALSGTGATIDNVSAAYLPQNNPPVVQLHHRAYHGDAGQRGREGREHGQRGNDPLQRHGDRYRRRDAGEFHRHADANALARRAQQLMISWQADDPDGDKLVYELDFRGEGERDWKLSRRTFTTPPTRSTAMRWPTAATSSK